MNLVEIHRRTKTDFSFEFCTCEHEFSIFVDISISTSSLTVPSPWVFTVVLPSGVATWPDRHSRPRTTTFVLSEFRSSKLEVVQVLWLYYILGILTGWSHLASWMTVTEYHWHRLQTAWYYCLLMSGENVRLKHGALRNTTNGAFLLVRRLLIHMNRTGNLPLSHFRDPAVLLWHQIKLLWFT